MGFVLILWAANGFGTNYQPTYHEYFTMKSCQEALAAVKAESKGAITGVCTPK
jgi:hypothetical protein